MKFFLHPVRLLHPVCLIDRCIEYWILIRWFCSLFHFTCSSIFTVFFTFVYFFDKKFTSKKLIDLIILYSKWNRLTRKTFGCRSYFITTVYSRLTPALSTQFCWVGCYFVVGCGLKLLATNRLPRSVWSMNENFKFCPKIVGPFFLLNQHEPWFLKMSWSK